MSGSTPSDSGTGAHELAIPPTPRLHLARWQLATTGVDGRVFVWSRDGDSLATPHAADAYLTDVAYSSGGRYLGATGSDGWLSIFAGDTSETSRATMRSS